MLVSNYQENKTALTRFKNGRLQRVPEVSNKGIFGLKAKNKEQLFAFDLLLDKDVPLVSLLGKAGSGKTLLSIAAAMELVLDKQEYSRIVIMKSLNTVGSDIGFLPGPVIEKLLPRFGSIEDNLRFLLNNDKIKLEKYIQDGMIDIEPIAFIRGRSISNSFVIIDEAQNLSVHEIKTILTRISEGTKIVLTADIFQIFIIFCILIFRSSYGTTRLLKEFFHPRMSWLK